MKNFQDILTPEMVEFIAAGNPLWRNYCVALQHPDTTERTRKFLRDRIVERMAQRGCYQRIDIQKFWETEKLPHPVYTIDASDKYRRNKYVFVDADTLDSTAREIRTLHSRKSRAYRLATARPIKRGN